jgi:UDP-N-acetylglucosamine 2-epimerase (hydrolysing)
MRFEYFLVLMKHAAVMVGNSSAGVREAPAYAVPSVNIGTRQNRRFHSSSIVDVAEDRAAIGRALANLPKGLAPVHHFGRGNCAEAFLQVLCGQEIWSLPTQKQFNDAAEMATRYAK